MKEPVEQRAAHGELASVPADAVHCVSGLIYQVLKPGRDEQRPGPEDVVEVLYRAQPRAGDPADPPDQQGASRTLRVDRAIPGLAEAFQLMTVGQRMRVWIPAHLASEEPPGSQEAAVTLDIELVGFTRLEPPPSPPPELTSPRKPD